MILMLEEYLEISTEHKFQNLCLRKQVLKTHVYKRNTALTSVTY